MDPPLIDKHPEARLEAAGAISDGRLRIDYEVKNTGKQAIYVFNKLYTKIDHNGVWHVDPNRVYIILSAGKLILAKRVIPVPDDLDVEKPEVPCVTKIDPERSFRETVTLQLPLSPWTPYQPKPLGSLQTSQAEFTWEIGYFVEKPGTSKLANTVRTPDGTAIHFSSFNPASQSILRAGPFPFRVAVQGRKS
jgi:hypothetical protein